MKLVIYEAKSHNLESLNGRWKSKKTKLVNALARRLPIEFSVAELGKLESGKLQTYRKQTFWSIAWRTRGQSNQNPNQNFIFNIWRNLVSWRPEQFRHKKVSPNAWQHFSSPPTTSENFSRSWQFFIAVMVIITSLF